MVCGVYAMLRSAPGAWFGMNDGAYRMCASLKRDERAPAALCWMLAHDETDFDRRSFESKIRGITMRPNRWHLPASAPLPPEGP